MITSTKMDLNNLKIQFSFKLDKIKIKNKL